MRYNINITIRKGGCFVREYYAIAPCFRSTSRVILKFSSFRIIKCDEK